jgi:hypothetical protein
VEEYRSDQRLTNGCVLMFSGGRDSSIAAVRLAHGGRPPTLVTITSDHLFGIDKVKQRLVELACHLPASTRWLRIVQPVDLATDTSFYEQTCLPCHHAYVVVATAVARSMNAQRLAFGYAGYQSDWPEQTPLAVSRLRAVLADYGIELDLPVADLASREQAEQELEALGLSPGSLEQKCSRQVTNLALDETMLRAQISLWEGAIRRSMDKLDRISAAIIEEATLGSLSGVSA